MERGGAGGGVGAQNRRNLLAMGRLLVLVRDTGAVEALEWLQCEYADCHPEFKVLPAGTAPGGVEPSDDDTVAVVVVGRDEVATWVNSWAQDPASAVLVCFRVAPDEGTRWYRQALSAGIQDGHSGAVKIAVGCRDTCAFEISCLCRCDQGPFDITEYRSRIEPRCPIPALEPPAEDDAFDPARRAAFDNQARDDEAHEGAVCHGSGNTLPAVMAGVRATSEPPADAGRARKRRRSSSADSPPVLVVLTSKGYERPYILACSRGSIPKDPLEAALKSDKTFHFTSSRPDEFKSAAWDLYFGIVALDEDKDGLPDGRPNPVREFHGGETLGCLHVEWDRQLE